MVLDNVFIAQYPTKHLGGLVNDRGIRDHINHACFPLRRRMGQRKRQRGNGFSAAGGHGQCKQAGGRIFTGIQAGAQDGASFAV